MINLYQSVFLEDLKKKETIADGDIYESLLKDYEIENTLVKYETRQTKYGKYT